MNAQTINQEQFRTNVTNSRHWIRLIYMLIFAALLHLAGLVMWVLCALQFIFSLLTGKDNGNLRSLGSSIATFVHQALDYVSYNTESKPFPFAPWPYNSRNSSEDEVVIVEPDNNNEDAGGNHK
ncbi:MAG TPA: DUF4389 domain-containing protein [Gammaproteobacteria bacterium]|jgi:hypothetical protein